MAATLILEGRPELVVRMALLLYLSESEKEKKKLEEKFGCGSEEIEDHIDTTKDVLQQLGWKPKAKGSAEVVRPEDIGQTDIFDGPSASTPKARTITVKCNCGAEIHNWRVPGNGKCPTCGASIEVFAVGEDDAKVMITPPAAKKEWSTEPVKVPCVKCAPAVFSAERKNGIAICPGCDSRYEIFLDGDGELLRAVPRPLPETGG